MFRLLVSSSVLALLSIPAIAADLPLPAEPVEVVAVPAYDWSGVYVGAHGGYSFGEADIDGIGTIDDFDGGLVGGQVGFNWQFNMFVVGVEGDASWTFAETDFGIGLVNVEVEENWTASARGRLGLAFNRFLVYGTGGAGWIDVDADASFAGVDIGGDSNTHFGWVAGGGGEALVTPNVSVGIEYLHSEYDAETYNIACAAVDGDGSTDVVRGRVNWKFGGLFGAQ
jgi:outer membrane immunogenic protein